MKFDSRQSIAIMGFAGLMAASLSGCGGGGGAVSAGEQQAQVTSFAVPVTKDNVGAIVGQDFRFSSGIQAVDKVTGEAISIPPTTLTVSASAESPSGYAFKMAFEDGTDVSGNFGFGSCIFTVVKSTSLNKSLTEGEKVTIDACKVGLNGQYAVTNQEAFNAEIMATLGSSKTDAVRAPVKILVKEDKGTVIINGQSVGDTRLEFVTGSTGAGG
ncbi:hypothetical protein [Malikia sp.]|uniref:hypothetical protein n=1 Tax=Malikia sp. TaxID=2070706 RepID=UPI00262E08A0|nr:hypothetical protein [Malikia sp.]MDD2728951.1 hypothetical protein [Malikia sp.]